MQQAEAVLTFWGSKHSWLQVLVPDAKRHLDLMMLCENPGTIFFY